MNLFQPMFNPLFEHYYPQTMLLGPRSRILEDIVLLRVPDIRYNLIEHREMFPFIYFYIPYLPLVLLAPLVYLIFRKNLSKVKDEFGIERSQKKKNKKDRNKKEPGFVRFLDGSLMVFNTITGSETELVKNYDRNGNLKNYRLEGQSITVSRKIPAGGSME